MCRPELLPAHPDHAMLGLFTGISFALFYATPGILVARWADRGDRKLIITLSLMVWSAMMVLCGMAQSVWQLAAKRGPDAVATALGLKQLSDRPALAGFDELHGHSKWKAGHPGPSLRALASRGSPDTASRPPPVRAQSTPPRTHPTTE